MLDWLELLKKLLSLITPELRKVICESLNQWVETAKKTKSPIDDLVAWIMTKLFGC